MEGIQTTYKPHARSLLKFNERPPIRFLYSVQYVWPCDPLIIAQQACMLKLDYLF